VCSNLVSSYTRWKWCQSHASSIKVPNPGSFITVFVKKENTSSQMGTQKKKYLKKLFFGSGGYFRHQETVQSKKKKLTNET